MDIAELVALRFRGWSSAKRAERRCACAEGVRLADERDAPAPKASGSPTSEARSFREAKVARGSARSFREAKVARARAEPLLPTVGVEQEAAGTVSGEGGIRGGRLARRDSVRALPRLRDRLSRSTIRGRVS